MYEYIKGTLTSLLPTTAILEAGGIGYNLSISLTTHSQLTLNEQCQLFVHYYTVQDQAPLLFGFATQSERALFRLLISVSGIGGGTARIMLSSHTPQELASIISTGNVAMLTKVKGIGAKTAEVVIVKLRDKVVTLFDSVELAGESSTFNRAMLQADDLNKGKEALEALMVLGFSKVAAEKVIKKVITAEPDLNVEDIIRKTLSML